MEVEWTREYLDELKIYRLEMVKAAETRLAETKDKMQSAEKDLKWWRETIPFNLHLRRKEFADAIDRQKKESAASAAYYAEKELEAIIRHRDRKRHEERAYGMWVVLGVGAILAILIGAFVFK